MLNKRGHGLTAQYIYAIIKNMDSSAAIIEKSLAVYKGKPAVVTEAPDKTGKLVIAVAGGESVKVRVKDIEPLHPGPCALSDIAPSHNGGSTAELRSAWELLEGEESSFSDLVALAYGAYTPRNAFTLYEALKDGLYFYGSPSSFKARTPQEVSAEEKKRAEKQKERVERDAFLERFRANRLVFPDDKKFLQDVEALALGQSDKSRALKELGRTETPEEAHKVLMDCGAWTLFVNPHPARYGCALSPAKAPVSPLPPEERVDLTSLPAFAIDNAWSSDPDDAVALEGGVLYVHIADPSASILPDSPADKEARGRGATLYLPEGAVRMLPDESLPLFALGLADVSPALTFKIALDDSFLPVSLESVEIFPSWVKVARLTYTEVDEHADDPRFAPLFAFASANRKRREAGGAVSIDFPETRISVQGDTITIEPARSFRSADMVKECMLITGEAAARWALMRRIPFPFVSQDAGDLPAAPLPGYAGSYQLRRCMRPRVLSTRPADHFGLGLAVYTQATSPLRRYTDLLAHQQIRRVLRGEPPLSEDETLMRLGAGEAGYAATVKAERASRAHWTAAYLSDKKGSEWEAVVLDKKGGKSLALIPDLGLETLVAARQELELNARIILRFSSASVPLGEFFFNQ